MVIKIVWPRSQRDQIHHPDELDGVLVRAGERFVLDRHRAFHPGKPDGDGGNEGNSRTQRLKLVLVRVSSAVQNRWLSPRETF
jgi:hypothetical protein